MAQFNRNAPCPCGSGKKYKKCCLGKDMEHHREEEQEAAAAVAAVQAEEEDDHDDENFEDYEDDDYDDGYDDEEEPYGIGGDDDYDGGEEDDVLDNGDVDTEVEDGDEEDEDYGKPKSPYPQIDQSLPEISPADEALVDAWVRQFTPLYKKNDADEMVRRIVAFMEERPDLFVHLALDEECLFELGAEFARRGQHSRYVDLLLRIRREHPEVYVRSHGFYDDDIVAELLLAGKQHAIPEYFNFFEQYPDSQPDELSSLISLLLATNCQEAVFDLARKTAIPCMRSPKVLGGNFVFQWFLFEQWIPFLDEGDASPEACRRLLATLQGIELPFRSHLDSEYITQSLIDVFHDLPTRDIATIRDRKGGRAAYITLCWSFTRFLHETRGMSWATARFFANRVESYLFSISEKKRPKNPLSFEQQRLDEHIATTCQPLFSLDGVQAISFLQALHEFAGYLDVNPLVGATESDAIREICVNLFELCKKGSGASDPGARIFADFPEYRWAV